MAERAFFLMVGRSAIYAPVVRFAHMRMKNEMRIWKFERM